MGRLCGAHPAQEGYLERAACVASGYRREHGFDEDNLEAGRPVRRLPPPPGERPMVLCTRVVAAGRGGRGKDVRHSQEMGPGD